MSVMRKESVQFCSEIYSLQEQMSITDFSRMARPKSAQDLHH